MKQSLFKKEFSVNGRNGEFKAEIRVTMNYGTKNISGTSSITHDDYTKNIPLHKVETFINGNAWSRVIDITSEEKVLDITKNEKNGVLKQLYYLANTVKQKTFQEQIEEIFDQS